METFQSFSSLHLLVFFPLEASVPYRIIYDQKSKSFSLPLYLFLFPETWRESEAVDGAGVGRFCTICLGLLHLVVVELSHPLSWLL
jgi:hypothetical protein